MAVAVNQDSGCVSTPIGSKGGECDPSWRRLLGIVRAKVAQGAEPIVASRVEGGMLKKLVEGAVPAIYVPRYFSRTAAARISAQLVARSGEASTWRIGGGVLAENYVETTTSHLGIPWNEAIAPNAGLLEAYFAQGEEIIDMVRRAGKESPVDQFISELKDLWKHGVERRKVRIEVPALPREDREKLTARLRDLARFEGRPMSALVGRYTHDQVPAHCDFGGPSFTNGYADALVSVNFFCSAPDVGGEFCVWKNLDCRIFHEAAAATGTNVIDAMLAFDPILRATVEPWSVRPQPGDLLLINTSFVHAVRSFGPGMPRLSVQTFLSSYDRGAPLQMWA